MNAVAAVEVPVAPDGTDTDEGALPVARTRHRWWWLAAAIALVLVAQFAHGLAANPGWDWPTFGRYFTARAVLAALRVTVELTFWGTLFGFLIGIWVAIGRLSKIPVLQVIAWAYVWAFRSIPLIVQLPARPAADTVAADARQGCGDHRGAAMSDYAVELRGVRKRFGAHEVLRGIDLAVRPGEVTVIRGPSGSGKSTVLRTINHLERRCCAITNGSGTR